MMERNKSAIEDIINKAFNELESIGCFNHLDATAKVICRMQIKNVAYDSIAETVRVMNDFRGEVSQIKCDTK